MTTFDEREQAFENRFIHDQDLAFQAEARRNGLAARWVAGLIGREPGDVEAYAAEIVQAGISGGGRGAVLARLRQDLVAARVPVSEQELERKMESLLAEALREVKEK